MFFFQFEIEVLQINYLRQTLNLLIHIIRYLIQWIWGFCFCQCNILDWLQTTIFLY